MLHAVCCTLLAACCMLHAACCMQYAVCCMLYAVCCMLYAVCCMLYAACCIPFTASRILMKQTKLLQPQNAYSVFGTGKFEIYQLEACTYKHIAIANYAFRVVNEGCHILEHHPIVISCNPRGIIYTR
jgi:hypothetical protein